ncbi:MAG: hypothetical protein LAP85_19655 [Acidobacteriia bacterium]|nr:hypothetical protein [Terriglobia bacterium]
MKMHTCLGLLAIGLMAGAGAFAQDTGWGVVGKVGTEGIGADVHRALVPRILNLRVGASFFRYSADITDKDIDYSGKLKLGAVPVVLDVYPFKNWFRLGGGIFVNLNEVNGTARPRQGLITINGHSYSTDQIGQMYATVKFNRAAPYFGLGFSNPIRQGKRWGFYFDLGAMYHGHPTAALTTTRTPVAQLQIDLNQQTQRFNSDARRFSVFPIIQFGISYHFGKRGR